MTREPDRVVVPAVADVFARPRWSVLIPTYNCARHLEEALNSVLIQAPAAADMEIIVVDDHSTRDDPGKIVVRVGGARVRFIRQESNVGKVRNFETGLLASRGTLVHQLHGDDKVRPGFYAAMEDAFDAFPEAGAFFCESAYIDDSGIATGRTGSERSDTGILEDWLDRIVVSQRIQTPSMVVRRKVYETLGGFDRRLDMVEDWEMWIRIANRYPVGFVNQQLAEYRVSPGGTTASSILSGATVGHLRKMIEIVDAYIPPETLSRQAVPRNTSLAQYLSQFIPFLVARGEFSAVARIYLAVLSFSRHPRTIYRLFHFTRSRGRSRKS